MTLPELLAQVKGRAADIKDRLTDATAECNTALNTDCPECDYICTSCIRNVNTLDAVRKDLHPIITTLCTIIAADQAALARIGKERNLMPARYAAEYARDAQGKTLAALETALAEMERG